MTISEIIEQLRYCQFECEGGPLENNEAFRALEAMAADEAADDEAQPPEMTEREKFLLALGVLRSIAMSYETRFDRDDTPTYVLADEALRYLGDDVERIHQDNDKMNELMRIFRAWRQTQND